MQKKTSQHKTKKDIPGKIQAFFAAYPQISVKKGAYLKPIDTKPEGVFLLKQGVVRCFAFSKEGAELTINMFKPISFFPVGWAINHSDDNYAYQAMTDVKVCLAPQKEFEVFLKNNPDVVYDLLRRIYKGLDGYFLRMEALLTTSPYFRTVVQLAICTRRFGVLEDKKYKVGITHAHLASLAGLSRETVTREMKKLIRQKIVSYEGKKLHVLNLSRLEDQLLS